MKTIYSLPLLISDVSLLLGFGAQAHPLEVRTDPHWRHEGLGILPQWLRAYNLTIGECPSYFGNISKEHIATQYACSLGCPDQFENTTQVQCLSPALTKERAESQGLLYTDNQGDAWIPGSCHCDDGEAAFLSTRQTKQPPDITQHGYEMSFSGTVDDPVDGIQKWTITSDKSVMPNQVIDEFGYVPGQNQLIVFEAWNSPDHDKTVGRLKLRDIAVGWYASKADQPLSNLDSVYITTIKEQLTLKAMVDARAKLEPDWDKTLTIYAGDTDTTRKQAWDSLLATPFGKGFSKMLQEYAPLQGKGLVAIEMMAGDNRWDMMFVIGPVPDELAEITER